MHKGLVVVHQFIIFHFALPWLFSYKVCLCVFVCFCVCSSVLFYFFSLFLSITISYFVLFTVSLHLDAGSFISTHHCVLPHFSEERFLFLHCASSPLFVLIRTQTWHRLVPALFHGHKNCFDLQVTTGALWV